MKKIIFGNIIGILVILAIMINIIPVFSSDEFSSIRWGSGVTDEMPPVISTADSNAKITTKHMSDGELFQKIEELWGSDIALKAKRINKEVDLNLRNGNTVRFLTPGNLTMESWSGYRLVRSGIYGVKGEFTARHCTGVDAVDGTWLGMGGVGENLIQTGVNMLTMEAWVEALPGDPVPVLDVNAGDDIHASVGISNDYPSYCYVVILDQTTYDTWGDYFLYSPDSRACWIVETPYKNDQRDSQYHIGDFSAVNFTSCQWWDSSLTYRNINYGSTGTLSKVKEQTLNNEVMTPSNLGGDGQSFSVDDP
jgi:hypothetical protein